MVHFIPKLAKKTKQRELKKTEFEKKEIMPTHATQVSPHYLCYPSREPRLSTPSTPIHRPRFLVEIIYIHFPLIFFKKN